MTTVRFEPSGLEVEVEPGSRMVDVTDEHIEAEVPYSCRAANCGTCRVEVVEGVEGLAQPEEEEADLLDVLGEGPEIRLCCQLILEKPVTKVVLRVVEP